MGQALDMAATGKIVVITGSTGAGKTTTCGEFVAQQDDLWLHFGVDLFFGKLVPRKFIDGGGSRSGEGLYTAPVDRQTPMAPGTWRWGRWEPA